MRNYEVFNTEQELLDRIRELKDSGYQYSEFEVYTSNELSTDYDYYYDVNKHDGEASFADKIAAFFTGEDPEERVFGKYDWDESVKEEARRAVDSGKYLLVVDEEGHYDNEENFDYMNNPEYRKDDEYIGPRDDEYMDNEDTVMGTGYNENLNPSQDMQYNQNLGRDRDLEYDENINPGQDGKYGENHNKTYDEELDRHFDDANLTDEERIKLHEERLDEYLSDKDHKNNNLFGDDEELVEEDEEYIGDEDDRLL